MKILLIDDDVECLESLKLALESKGYQSQAFSDPEAAVNAYRFGEFDVVITDYKMPKMNGVEVLEAIRAGDPDIRVMILTAFADTDIAIAAVNRGACSFFRKPLDIKSLLDTISKIEGELRFNRQKTDYISGLVDEFINLKDEFDSLGKKKWPGN